METHDFMFRAEVKQQMCTIKKIIFCLIVGLCVFYSTSYGSTASSKAEFYVAANGNDSYSGSQDKPFATLQRAKDAVGEKISTGLESNVTVLIRRGAYRLNKPLVFTNADSGTGEYSITYAAYPGERVVVSGGRPITGWQKKTGNIWTAELPDVKSGKWWFRDLYANDKRLLRARYPNLGHRISVIAVDKNDLTKITLSEPIVVNNPAQQNTELFVYHLCSISRALVESSSGNKIQTANPVGWIGHVATELQTGRLVYLENALEFLDQPGEWYLERKTGTLYYQGSERENPNKMNMIAPAQNTEQLLIVRGSKDSAVRNIHFDGIDFEHSSWQLPKQGYSDLWAGHYGTKYVDEPTYTLPAAIHLTYARGCSLSQCRIVHTGANGISFGAGSHHNKVRGCEFYDTGGTPVYVGWQRIYDEPPRRVIEDGWKDSSDAPSFNEIAHNYIHGCCTTNPGGVGIFVAFSPDTRIAHNEICDLPYTGISVGAIWNDQPTTQKRCIIEYNHVHNYNTVMYDSGGIYTLGRQDGTVIRNNLVNDSRFAHGIYTDEGSSFITIENNVVYRVGKDALHHHHGHDNLVRNNIFASAGRYYVMRIRNDKTNSFSIVNNIFWIDRGDPFQLKFLNDEPDNGKYVFDRNIYWSTRPYALQFNQHNFFSMWQESSGQDKNSIIADPKFADPENGDFTLKADSPAFKLGFKPIDISTVEPQCKYKRKCEN